MTETDERRLGLAEKLVLAIIVALIAAVLIPLIADNRTRAKYTEAEAGLITIRTCLREMHSRSGSYNHDARGTMLTTDHSVTNIPGISHYDLDGKYFQTAAYTIDNIGPDTYLLSVHGTGALANTSLTVDQDGNMTRHGF